MGGSGYVTLGAALPFVMQPPVSWYSSFQSLKADPDAAVGISVTLVPPESLPLRKLRRQSILLGLVTITSVPR